MYMLLRMALGGAVCGSFLGLFAGGLFGGCFGALCGDVSLGLDGALLGGGVCCIGGAAVGVFLAIWDNHAAPAPRSRQRTGPRKRCTTTAHPVQAGAGSPK